MPRPKTLEGLKPAPYNPREITAKALSGLGASMGEFGDLSGIVWNEQTGHLVAGHQRVKGLQAEHGDLEIRRGKIHTPDGHVFAVRVVDWPETREKAANLAANSHMISGTFTADLEGLLRELEPLEPDLFPSLNFDDLLVEVSAHTRTPPGPDGPPPPVAEGEPISRRGEVYELGPHRVMCGDSISAEDVDLLMGGAVADLLVTDPPYGVSYADKNAALNTMDGGSRNQTPIEEDHRKPKEMFSFWTLALSVACGVTKAGGSYFTTGPQGGDLLLLLQALIRSGWGIRHMLIWAKNNHVLGRCDFNYKHEPILYGWKPGAGHHFDASPGDCFSVWEVDRPHQSKEHPTMKPVALFAKAIGHGSRKGEVVLDVFLGSGTTIIAAAETGRICYGMEKDPHYVDVIRRRWTKWAKEHNQDPGPGALTPAE